jgi:formate dehydrogenase gamma subunit
MNALTKIERNGPTEYVRWAFNERVQHWSLAISFIFLAMTGFALKYPDSWWVRPISGVEWVFDLRGLVHRICGAVFLGLGVYHTLYMFGTRRGRMMISAFRPGLKDLRDAAQNISYNFGFSKHPPQFGHFSYMEKAEYLALIWGALIMGVTGLMLWFENFTLRFFPKWVIDLATVIHLYEAWLATLAIVVWHFYYVIVNPDIYPINTSMVNGKLTEKEMRDEYFLEWQALQKGDDEEEKEQETKEK